MALKSSLVFLKSLHAGVWLCLVTKFVGFSKNIFSEVRENSFLHGGISKEMTLDKAKLF